jgi:hypothetical protein
MDAEKKPGFKIDYRDSLAGTCPAAVQGVGRIPYDLRFPQPVGLYPGEHRQEDKDEKSGKRKK